MYLADGITLDSHGPGIARRASQSPVLQVPRLCVLQRGRRVPPRVYLKAFLPEPLASRQHAVAAKMKGVPGRHKITLLALMLAAVFASWRPTIASASASANAATISKTASGDFFGSATARQRFSLCNSKQALEKSLRETPARVCALSYGKEADQLSRLNYYGYRYYDPLSLQWTQSDPLFRVAPDLAYDQPRRMSLYAFSLNNPVRYLDPDGRDPASGSPTGLELQNLEKLHRALLTAVATAAGPNRTRGILSALGLFVGASATAWGEKIPGDLVLAVAIQTSNSRAGDVVMGVRTKTQTIVSAGIAHTDPLNASMVLGHENGHDPDQPNGQPADEVRVYAEDIARLDKMSKKPKFNSAASTQAKIRTAKGQRVGKRDENQAKVDADRKNFFRFQERRDWQEWSESVSGGKFGGLVN